MCKVYGKRLSNRVDRIHGANAMFNKIAVFRPMIKVYV